MSSAQDRLDAFLNHLRHERRLSSHTLDNYSRDLSGMLQWCDDRGLRPWNGLDQHHVRDYVVWRHRRGASGKTIQRELSALRPKVEDTGEASEQAPQEPAVLEYIGSDAQGVVLRFAQ